MTFDTTTPVSRDAVTQGTSDKVGSMASPTPESRPVTLRPWASEDAPTILHLAEESPDLWRQLPDPDRVREVHCSPVNGDGGRWKFAICVAGEPVGNVAVQLRGMRTGWCSYWLAAGSRGRGLATTGLVALCHFAFESLDVFRLELAHRTNNPASGNVARRAGFTPEGVMRAELEYDGVRYDTRLWSRLATDPAPDQAPLVIPPERTAP